MTHPGQKHCKPLAETLEENFEQNVLDQDKKEIFGFSLLKLWNFLNKRGKKYKLYENLAKIAKIAEIAGIKDIIKRQFQNERTQFLSELNQLGKIDRRALFFFFYDYFQKNNKAALQIAKSRGLLKTDDIATIDPNKLAANLAKICMDIYSPDSYTQDKMLLVAIFCNPEKYFRHLPIKILMGAVKNYVELSLETEEGTKRIVQANIEIFRTDISAIIRQGMFPGLSQTAASIKLDTLTIEILDKLNAVLDKKSGDYDGQSHKARILTEDVSPDRIGKITIHEAIHAVSGRTQYSVSEEDIDYEDSNLEFLRRIGLHFLKIPNFLKIPTFPEGECKRPSFRWLNEAVTEQAVIDYQGREDQKNTYAIERKLLHRLITAGIPKESFYRAYFEDFKITEPGEHRTPELRNLFKKTNEIFGQRFLVNLDAYIRIHGAKDALEKWEAIEAEFPKYLSDCARSASTP